MAQSRKDAADGRVKRIDIRVTPEELARIDERAGKAGLSRSDFIRNAAMTGRVAVKQARHPNFQLIHELNKIGVNLNQVVHAAHIRGKLPQSLPVLCEEIERLVMQAAEEVGAE